MLLDVAIRKTAFNRAFQSQPVLLPKGAPAPRKFAGGNEEVFASAVYTSNPVSFYAAPGKGGKTT